MDVTTGKLVPTASLICALLAFVGCSAEKDKAAETTATASEALTATQERVLGFEAPNADWTSPSGVIGASGTPRRPSL